MMRLSTLRLSLQLACATGLMLLAAGRVWAWGDVGHMLVAEIAQEHMTPEARKQADKLLAFDTDSTTVLARSRTFVEAASWADDIKRARGTGAAHYINYPISADGTQLQREQEPETDVVRAIEQCKSLLSSTTASERQRAESLRYLIHFMGDIHQPLHCVTRVTAAQPGGDQGGNLYRLSGGNLHSFWDGGAGAFRVEGTRRPLTVTGRKTIEKMAGEIEKQYPWSEKLAPIVGPEAIAKEGFALAKENVYEGIHELERPSAAYTSRAQAICKRQVAKGGYRLADLLNRLLDPAAKSSLMKTEKSKSAD